MRLFTHGVRLPVAAEGTVKRTLIVYHDGQPISRVEMKAGTTFSTMKFGRTGTIRLFDATAQGDALVAELSFDKIPAQDFALQITGSVPVTPEVEEPSANKAGEAPLDQTFISPKLEVEKCDAPATEPTAPESEERKESVSEILARLRAKQQ